VTTYATQFKNDSKYVIRHFFATWTRYKPNPENMEIFVMRASKNAWLKAIHIFGVCVAILIEFLFVQNQVSAETIGTNILFILDGSGSMWGRLDNIEKIVIAKDTMSDLVQDFPSDRFNIGLMVYGHRRKGDCDDIEILAPLGKVDNATIIKQIQSIIPKGKTPITKSITLAIQRLEALEEETTIVLVSDGKETCKGDPCALVQTLKEKGVNFTMHVVGFDVTDEEKKQLACIAKAGGGMYLTAQNASQLKGAFTQVKKEIIEKQEVKKNNVEGRKFVIIDDSHSANIISGGEKGDLTIKWDGNPIFPLTMIYRPRIGWNCPQGGCTTVKATFHNKENPLVSKGALWCHGYSKSNFFDYEVILRDASGQETPPIIAGFNCIVQ
jgi:Mg-chelatase subunit ChlD